MYGRNIHKECSCCQFTAERQKGDRSMLQKWKRIRAVLQAVGTLLSRTVTIEK